MPKYKTVRKFSNKGYELMKIPSAEWYCLNGKLHRPDGPAVIIEGATEDWYLEGTKLEPKQVKTLYYLKDCPLEELPLYINTVFKSIVRERLAHKH